MALRQRTARSPERAGYADNVVAPDFYAGMARRTSPAESRKCNWPARRVNDCRNVYLSALVLIQSSELSLHLFHECYLGDSAGLVCHERQKLLHLFLSPRSCVLCRVHFLSSTAVPAVPAARGPATAKVANP